MYLIVTNNPMAAKEFAGQGEVRLYPEDTYREILVRARDLVYIGHRLCNHPLYGSLRPHETPYRTVVLSDRPQTPDEEECLIMSEAITRIDTFTPPDRAKMPRRILEDYQMIDCSLVRNTFATVPPRSMAVRMASASFSSAPRRAFCRRAATFMPAWRGLAL